MSPPAEILDRAESSAVSNAALEEPVWDAEEAVSHDRRVERSLLVKEAVVVAVIVALVVLRIAFVR